MKQKTFGRYKIIEKIGQGGMGVVYKALDPDLGRQVALKVLYGEEDTRIQSRERFLVEAKATAKLQHPNIIKLHDFGIEQNRHFFTMEFIEGRSLNEVCKKSSFPVKRIVDIMIKVARAIHYAHEQGVIHRDIKPANIMIDKSNEPKVMDFGLAKVEHTGKRLSKAGMIIGTLEYMSPEQAKGNIYDIDVCSDVYSLGATLYKLLTHRAPFAGTDSFNLIYNVINADVIAPSKLNHRISAELECICMKAMEKSKKHRYQSAAALADDLERFMNGENVEARTYGGFQKLYKKLKRHWISSIFYILSAFFSIAAVIYYSNIIEPDSIDRGSSYKVEKVESPKENTQPTTPSYKVEKVETPKENIQPIPPSYKVEKVETPKENIQPIPPSYKVEGVETPKENTQPTKPVYIGTTQISSENVKIHDHTVSADTIPVACVVDTLGNLYVIGEFRNQVNSGKDWQKESKKISPGDTDIFITRISSVGRHSRTKNLGFIRENSFLGATIDSSNNLYLAHNLKGMADFRKDSEGKDERTSQESKCFVSRFHSDCQYGGAIEFPYESIMLTIDSHDNLYVFGRQKKGENYCFSLICINCTNPEEAVRFKVSSKIFPTAVVTDTVGDIYMIRTLKGGRQNFSIDTQKTDIKTEAGDEEVFIYKMLPSGINKWTKRLSVACPNKCEGISLTTDMSNNVYVAGVFSGQVDFGKEWGISDLKNSGGHSDIFVTKINSDGTYCWTKCAGGSSGKSNPSLAADRYGNIYICGYCKNTLEPGKDWGDTADTKKPAREQGIFITKVYSDGSHGWTKIIEGLCCDNIKGVVVDQESFVYLYGYFSAPIDFGKDWGQEDKKDPGMHTNIFITKIR